MELVLSRRADLISAAVIKLSGVTGSGRAGILSEDFGFSGTRSRTPVVRSDKCHRREGVYLAVLLVS